MAVAVPMTNPMTGRTAIGLQGFSWTTLFFGVFPALFRGHIIAFLVMGVVAFFTMGLSWLVFPFFYNGWHWNYLIKQGYVPNTLLTQQQGMRMQNVVNVHVGAHATAPGVVIPGTALPAGAASAGAPVAMQSAQGSAPQLTDDRPTASLIEHSPQRSSGGAGTGGT